MSDNAVWDRVAPAYDKEAGHGLRSPAEAALWQELFTRLFPPDPTLRVLDVGTGTGFVAFILAGLGHEVTGVDFSDGMLAVARDKAVQAPDRVRFLRGDATGDLAKLPDLVPAGGFDAVVSRHVIWALPEPARTIADWAALVRPGGRVVAIDGIWATFGFADRSRELLGVWLEAIRTRRWVRRMRSNPALPLRNIREPSPTAEAFAAAGLTEVHSERLPALDRAEHAAMSLTERLRSPWRRYLVQGTVA